MTKLTILRGLPGSGKTTLAKAEYPNSVLVERDILRVELYPLEKGQAYYVHPDFQRREARVTQVLHDRIRDLLAQGKDVVSADTSLPARTVKDLARIARSVGNHIEVEVVVVDTPVEECIRRQKFRPEDEQVPEKVIRRMHTRYFPLKEVNLTARDEEAAKFYASVEPVKPLTGAPWALIVDIDGTVASHEGIRGHHDYHRVLEDAPKGDIIDLVNFLWPVHMSEVIFVSGRPDSCREDTVEWLKAHGLPSGNLFMRKTGDFRPDYLVKYELFNEHIRGKYNVGYVLDDRNSVVAMWRALGLTCLQVADGAF